MAEAHLLQRVDTLEDYMKDLSYQALKTEREIARLSLEMRQFKDEMLEFKNEMREFKDEMRGFKDEMLEFKNEMLEFKNEMRGFKDEMLEFKNEMGEFKDEMREFKVQAEQDRKRLNQKWGELANKMGTLVEDLVAPSLPRVARKLFGCEEPEFFSVRVRRKMKPGVLELDALLVCKDIVLINETKSTLKSQHVDQLPGKLQDFRRYFPEYADREVMGVLASLYVDDSVVRYASKNRILVMGMGDEAMEVLNPEVVE